MTFKASKNSRSYKQTTQINIFQGKVIVPLHTLNANNFVYVRNQRFTMTNDSTYRISWSILIPVTFPQQVGGEGMCVRVHDTCVCVYVPAPK